MRPRHALVLGIVPGIVLAASLTGAVRAADSVRVSIKHILNSDGVRSSGVYLFDATVRETFLEMNNVLEDMSVRWRLDIVDISNVSGASKYFSLGEDEWDALEHDARDNDPRGFKWRSDAINIFIVNDIEGGAAGFSSFPGGDGSGHRDIVVIQNHFQGEITNMAGGWLHEIGHYLGLLHTFQCDHDDCDKSICQGQGATHRGWSARCPDVCPHDDNLMSYNDTQDWFSITGKFTACQIENMNFELYDPRGDRNNVLLSCLNACGEKVADCRKACEDTRAACREVCDEASKICVAGCWGAGEVCRGTCKATGDTCRAGCDGAVGACYAGCDAICFFDSDSDACIDCKAECASLRSRCESPCNQVEASCASGCDTPEECFATCNGVQTDCYKGCDDVATTCLAPCTLIYADCASDCEPLPAKPLNLAKRPGVDVKQSSTYGGNLFPADFAVDGNLNTFSHTAAGQGSPAFWRIDLNAEYEIETVVLENRLDCCQSRLRDLTVKIFDGNSAETFTSALLNQENGSYAGSMQGPRRLVLHHPAAHGSRVRGQIVEITRTPDPDLSGTGGAGGADEKEVLTLAEVEIYGDPALPPNTSITRQFDSQTTSTATQSSVGYGGVPERAIDGDENGAFPHASVTHTAEGDPSPWWELDLGATFPVGRIVIWNRTDCCSQRFNDIKVLLLDSRRTVVHQSTHFTDGSWPDTTVAGYEIPVEGADARTLRIEKMGDLNGSGLILSLAEVEVFTASGEAPRFVRGDADSSGVINISDALVVLSYLFTGGRAPACMDAADADDQGTGSPTISDGIRILSWLFTGGASPPAPAPHDARYIGGDCGSDPTPGDGMGCAVMSAICR